jgi:hypothetical protein
MKKLLVLLLLTLFSIQLTAQFKAKMVFTSMGQERIFTVFSAGGAYRYEFNEQGQAGIIIGQENSSELMILVPQQKIAMKAPAGSPMSMGSDPIGSYNYYKNNGTVKEIGPETVNGIKCIKSELWNVSSNEYGQANQKMFTVWYSDRYNFPIKIINHIDGTEGSGMELKDLEPWTPDAHSFEVPADYTIMNAMK